ncbi:hypothetical protein PybrP1_001674 [[Pythium] brassicae (nom. inval.)]|nr:hypothetical protein PybrP1_001674 [[Pythium] brassicae (nom. inval.)]
MAKTTTAPKSALSATATASASASSSSSATLAAANGSGAPHAVENALKLQNLKGIHEDDGGAAERAADEQQPLDAHVMRAVLASMGAERHEPRVVSQLLEFVHRYVTEILLDAQEYAMYADKPAVDADDIRLAIASRLNHHYAQLPSRELMMELAEKRNSVPLPPISNEYGVRLPPVQHQLVTRESDRQEQAARASLRESDGLSVAEDLELAMGNGVSSARSRPPLHPGEGSRNKRVSRHQIPINLHR